MNELNKQLLIKNYTENPKGWRKWLSAQKEILDELNDDYPLLDSIPEKVYWLVNDVNDYPKCVICGSPITKFVGRIVGYHKHCCCSCAQLDKQTQQKQRQTKLELYGSETYNNQDKYKETCAERYGVDNIRKSEQFKQHAKQVKLEKYGDENYNNRSAAKQTCVDKYGATTFVHSDVGKNVISNIMLNRYGVDHHWKNDSIHQKCFDTVISKYGGIGNSSEYIKNKSVETLLNKTGYTHNWSDPECRNKCYKTCLERYETEHPVLLHPPRGVTKGHQEVFEFISDIYKGDIILNDRHLRDADSHVFELDIFMPKINVAIEYDGDYWHSLPDMIARDQIKNSLCKYNGIKLIRILESRWLSDKDAIKQELQEELNLYV